MNAIWTIVTIIASTSVATATVIGVYNSHKRALEEKIKDLESKVHHHGKFVEILEKKALSALEDEFNNKK